MADPPKRRPRRQFTDEFKAGAVHLVLDQGKTVGEAARDVDLTETAQREWNGDRTIEGSAILVAAGRTPNTDGIGLEQPTSNSTWRLRQDG